MGELETLIASAKAAVSDFRRRGLQIDAAAARIRLAALLEARRAVLGGFTPPAGAARQAASTDRGATI